MDHKDVGLVRCPHDHMLMGRRLKEVAKVFGVKFAFVEACLYTLLSVALCLFLGQQQQQLSGVKWSKGRAEDEAKREREELDWGS